ncbi:MAG: hypothetical protein KF729_32075 [Sandaracinaceae bacterium]|nr:hypothetical protein [Sandaracinaceae bacterium]
MGTSWFEMLFGFAEGDYDATRARFALEGETLVSRANGRRFGVGRFSTPSLESLRERVVGARPGALRVTHEVIGDALELHAQPENEGALFQVASQLNCLEFADPREIPENGVTDYAHDPTQGPACALAAAAATVFRNYFVEVGGQRGQRRDRQIDNLAELRARLGDAGQLVDVRNGYTFSSPERLRALGAALAGVDREALMGALRVGLQRGVEVTFARRFTPPDTPRRVSQVFCSALSCGYASGSLEEWRPLATLVLDGAYEATLWAAALDAEEGAGSGKVWLTFLGGGAFGNDKAWIGHAIGRALARAEHVALDVRVAHFRKLDRELCALVDEARARPGSPPI